MSMIEHLQEIVDRGQELLDHLYLYRQGMGDMAIQEIAQEWIDVCYDYDPYGFNQDPLELEDAVRYLTRGLDDTIRGIEDWFEEVKGDLDFRLPDEE